MYCDTNYHFIVDQGFDNDIMWNSRVSPSEQLPEKELKGLSRPKQGLRKRKGSGSFRGLKSGHKVCLDFLGPPYRMKL